MTITTIGDMRETIISLRQQLADEFDKREALDNELANREAQIVNLRGVVSNVANRLEAQQQPFSAQVLREALAATDDLSGYILMRIREGEPK